MLRACEGVVVRVVLPRYVTDVLNIIAFQVPSRHIKGLIVSEVPLEQITIDQTSMFVLIALVKFEIMTCTHVSRVRTVDNLNLE